MRGMYGTLVSLCNAKPASTHVHAEVQQFAVWEKGAKDESGFVGYCYLDLFPRGTALSRVCGLCSHYN